MHPSDQNLVDVKSTPVQLINPVSPSVSQCWLSSMIPYGQAVDWFCTKAGLVLCLLVGVSSDYAQPITGQVTDS